MARTGRFGSLPGQPPDISSTVTSLLEQYESARDRNIYTAWANGGEFEGEPVTDKRLIDHFKERRDSYTKDAPEWDQWNQQVVQLKYQVGESKTLLSYAQGKMNETAVSNWYSREAQQFPRNSEAWRNAMKNAATYKKAAQEKMASNSSISQSERFQRQMDRIARDSITPATRVMDVLNNAMNEVGITASSFMDANEYDYSLLDEKLANSVFEYRDRDPGKGLGLPPTDPFYAFGKLNSQWRNITGRDMTIDDVPDIIKKAEHGIRQQIRLAKKNHYQSYVPELRNQLKGLQRVRARIDVVRADVFDAYHEARSVYTDAMSEAETPEERMAARLDYANVLEDIATKAGSSGDYLVSGKLKDELSVMRDGVVIGTGTVNEGLGPTSDTTTYANVEGVIQPTYDESGNVARLEGMSNLEYEAALRKADIDEIIGIANGDLYQIWDPKAERYNTYRLNELPDGVAPEQSTDRFAVYGKRRASAQTLTFGGQTVTVPAHDVWTYVEKTPVQVRLGQSGDYLQMPVSTYTLSGGQRMWEYITPAGAKVTSALAPFSFLEDGDESTPPGTVNNNGAQIPLLLSEQDRTFNGQSYHVMTLDASAFRAAYGPDITQNIVSPKPSVNPDGTQTMPDPAMAAYSTTYVGAGGPKPGDKVLPGTQRYAADQATASPEFRLGGPQYENANAVDISGSFRVAVGESAVTAHQARAWSELRGGQTVSSDNASSNQTVVDSLTPKQVKWLTRQQKNFDNWKASGAPDAGKVNTVWDYITYGTSDPNNRQYVGPNVTDPNDTTLIVAPSQVPQQDIFYKNGVAYSRSLAERMRQNIKDLGWNDEIGDVPLTRLMDSALDVSVLSNALRSLYGGTRLETYMFTADGLKEWAKMPSEERSNVIIQTVGSDNPEGYLSASYVSDLMVVSGQSSDPQTSLFQFMGSAQDVYDTLNASILSDSAVTNRRLKELSSVGELNPVNFMPTSSDARTMSVRQQLIDERVAASGMNEEQAARSIDEQFPFLKEVNPSGDPTAIDFGITRPTIPTPAGMGRPALPNPFMANMERPGVISDNTFNSKFLSRRTPPRMGVAYPDIRMNVLSRARRIVEPNANLPTFVYSTAGNPVAGPQPATYSMGLELLSNRPPRPLGPPAPPSVYNTVGNPVAGPQPAPYRDYFSQLALQKSPSVTSISAPTGPKPPTVAMQYGFASAPTSNNTYGLGRNRKAMR